MLPFYQERCLRSLTDVSLGFYGLILTLRTRDVSQLTKGTGLKCLLQVVFYQCAILCHYVHIYVFYEVLKVFIRYSSVLVVICEYMKINVLQLELCSFDPDGE